MKVFRRVSGTMIEVDRNYGDGGCYIVLTQYDTSIAMGLDIEAMKELVKTLQEVINESQG